MSSTSDNITDDKTSQHTPKSCSHHPLERQVTFQPNTDQYERLFFQPSPAKGDLSQRFATPTLLGLLGFLIPITSTTLSLLHFQTSTPYSFPALSPSYIFTGGLCMLVAGLLEYPLGNTFPFTVFTVYGTFWLSHGFSLLPSSIAALSEISSGDGRFDAGQGNFFLVMAVTSFLFLVGSVRTNAPFVVIFFGLGMLFTFLATGCFNFSSMAKKGDSEGVVDVGRMWFYFRIAGGFGVVALAAGWYLAIITVCAATEVPCSLPVFDLSKKVNPRKKGGLENGHEMDHRVNEA